MNSNRPYALVSDEDDSAVQGLESLDNPVNVAPELLPALAPLGIRETVDLQVFECVLLGHVGEVVHVVDADHLVLGCAWCFECVENLQDLFVVEGFLPSRLEVTRTPVG